MSVVTFECGHVDSSAPSWVAKVPAAERSGFCVECGVVKKVTKVVEK